MCQCCPRDNYLSVNFPTQPCLLFSCLGLFKVFPFSTFPTFYETYTPALQLAKNRIAKIGDIFQLVPKQFKDRNRRYYTLKGL